MRRNSHFDILWLQIHLAAQSDQPDVVKLFLQKQPSLVTTTTKVLIPLSKMVAHAHTIDEY